MGELLSKAIGNLAAPFSSSKRTKILLLGLDGADKITVVYKLKLDKYVSTVMTISLTVKNIDYKNLRMSIWDVGGSDRIKSFWVPYYSHTDALIFIIDSCDEERLEFAKERLYAVLSNEELRDVPVLVYANKQDTGRITPEEMMTRLELEKMKRSWKIQGTCALSGEGLNEGLEWLSQELKKSKK